MDGAKLLSFLGKQLAHWPQDVTDRYLQTHIRNGNRIRFGNFQSDAFTWDMTDGAIIEEHYKNSRDPLVGLILSFNDAEDTVVFFNQLFALYDSTYPATTVLDLWFDKEFAPTRTNLTPRLLPSLDILHSFTAVETLNLEDRSLLTSFHFSDHYRSPVGPFSRHFVLCA